jgi:DHA1 family bicyclomycin/chloramphenicol resistance-like MFS transporter
MVIGTALVKDCFPENRRMDVLLIVQGSKIIGPVIAPVIGSQILLFFSWRVTFVALSVLGVLCILMTCAYRESLSKEQRIKASVIKTFAQLAAVMRNKSFTTFLLITAFFSATPFFAYLTTSPFIYQTFFGCTAQEYSYFFAATAAVSTVGLLLYKYFSRFVSQKNITTTLILCVIVSGIGLLTMGKSSAIWFFVMILLFAIADTLTQPFRTKHLLEAQEHDAGSASAMMSCVEYAFGCFGALMLISLTQDYIFGLGILMFAGAAIALLLWIYFLRVGLTIKGLND